MCLATPPFPPEGNVSAAVDSGGSLGEQKGSNVARFPCDSCHRPFRGRAAYFYPALVNGADSLRSRLRVCESCQLKFVNVLQPYAETDTDATTFGDDASETCALCRIEVRDDDWRFYVTAYVSDARLDFYTRVHRWCAESANGQPLPGACLTLLAAA